ncbi:MAG: hypothetical protein PPHEMADM_4874 [uncultured Paraburkholderia sp.]|nr:MAG: hypothetical protein PPHEMADE_4853 [uncultured Paraburkholderia sp.]CAH2940654.1 MAG: hypothetical protein PPHEMADM_4874 [uncultured Paraburkholderia sp.]
MQAPERSHRLSILTRQEIDDLYGVPRFTDEGRQAYFELDEAESRAVHSRTIPIAVHLTLQLGYFRAKRQFFDYDLETVREDLHYVVRRHFPQRGSRRYQPAVPSHAACPEGHHSRSVRISPVR